MATLFEPTTLPGVVLCRPALQRDHRGVFLEQYRQDQYRAAGIEPTFVQHNQSCSAPRVLRGMHLQRQHPQAKLVSVMQGRIFDVVVDVRRGSPTFGRWEGFELTATGGEQLFVPEGLAHGFCVPDEAAQVLYLCSNYYAPGDEMGFRWDSLVIDWPVRNPVLSDKDASLPRFSELPPEQFPVFEGPCGSSTP